MQPRPRVLTVREEAVPSVRCPMSGVVMPSTFRLRARSKSSDGRDLVLVERDLVVDGPQVGRDLGELALNELTVREQQVEPLGLVAVALADERGIAAYVPDGHAGGAQPGHHLDPAQVLVGVAPVARRG